MLLRIEFGFAETVLRRHEPLPKQSDICCWVALYFMILLGAAYAIVGLINLATLVRLGI